MSRSGYSEGCEGWELIMWRGAVQSAIRGRRGQALIAEMISALEALPEKQLITNDLEKDGQVCALGAVGRARGIEMSGIDPENSEQVAAAFGIAPALAKEISFLNDEMDWRDDPGTRWRRMYEWAREHVRKASE